MLKKETDNSRNRAARLAAQLMQQHNFAILNCPSTARFSTGICFRKGLYEIFPRTWNLIPQGDLVTLSTELRITNSYNASCVTSSCLCLQMTGAMAIPLRGLLFKALIGIASVIGRRVTYHWAYIKKVLITIAQPKLQLITQSQQYCGQIKLCTLLKK